MIPEIKPLSLEETRARFSKVHGKTQAAPPFPAMLFGGVLNNAQDVLKAKILLMRSPSEKRPQDN